MGTARLARLGHELRPTAPVTRDGDVLDRATGHLGGEGSDLRRACAVLPHLDPEAATGAGHEEGHEAIDGISQRMLTRTLRSLERDGLVARTVHPVVPPRVDYELTDLGRTLLEPVAAVADWAERNRAAVQAARDRHDAAQPNS